MKTTTILRLVGGAVLLWMVYLVGVFNLTSPLVAVFLFGFAAAFEFRIVRPVGKRGPPAAVHVVPLGPTSTTASILNKVKVPATAPAEPARALVAVPPSSPMLTEDVLWATALAELEEGRRHSGTWAKCFAAADGDEAKAKAAYLRERVHRMEGDVTASKQAAPAEQELGTKAAESREERITPDEKSTTVTIVRQDHFLRQDAIGQSVKPAANVANYLQRVDEANEQRLKAHLVMDGQVPANLTDEPPVQGGST